jgi:hypothetical protein
MTERVRRLWAGEVPLARTFWEYAIVYGLLVNLLATIASFALLTEDASGVSALVLFLLPVPYNVLVMVAVWRSAARYPGPPVWADLARAAVVVWTLAALIF